MYGGSTLPMTGAGVLMFGHVIGMDVLVAAGVGAVLGGITLYRLGARTYARVAR